jgi:hypothetical protein
MTTTGGDTTTNTLKRITWQSENCLSCKWFSPSDPINADILTNGRCVHPGTQEIQPYYFWEGLV